MVDLLKTKNSFRGVIFSSRFALFMLLVGGFIIRFVGIDFGLPFIYSADEHSLTMPALKMITEGSLNPEWYSAGTFVIYCIVLFWLILIPFYMFGKFLSGNPVSWAEIKEIMANIPQADPTFFYFSARLLMVIFGAVSLYVVYLIAKRLFNKPIALLSIFCFAISPIHISHSKIIRPDIATTFMILLSIYFLIRFVSGENKNLWLILSSVFAGFAIAAKYTSGIVIFPLLLFAIIRDYELNFKNKKFAFGLKVYLLDFIKFKACLSKSMIFIFISYFIFAPFTVIEYQKLFSALEHEARSTHLGYERLSGIKNHLWYIKETFRDGIGGLFFEIFAFIGLLSLFIKKFSKPKAVLIMFPILMFVIIGCAKLRWSRWMMPIIPFEAIFFGVGLYFVYGLLCLITKFKNSKAIAILLGLAVAVAAFPAIKKDVQYSMKLNRVDTRTISKRWVEENLPANSKIVYERYTPHLHIKPRPDLKLYYTGWSRIVSRPLEFYAANGIDYLIITDSFKNRYYNEPLKYNVEVSRYEQLKTWAELVKFFDNETSPGTAIEIYKLPRMVRQ